MPTTTATTATVEAASTTERSYSRSVHFRQSFREALLDAGADGRDGRRSRDEVPEIAARGPVSLDPDEYGKRPDASAIAAISDPSGESTTVRYAVTASSITAR